MFRDVLKVKDFGSFFFIACLSSATASTVGTCKKPNM